MAIRAQYKTKHREELLSYLAERPGQHITAGEICRDFSLQGKNIAAATVYRHLERFVDEGLVSKFIIDEGSSSCYAYNGVLLPEDAPACFHCKCEKCGRLIHLDCREVSRLGEHLMEHHGFVMDPLRTVFYGVCADCRAAEEK